MPVTAVQKATLPHEAVELFTSGTNNNQLAISGPSHQITTINAEEIESTAHTVMFVTTETSASAHLAIPTTWGQRQGILVVLGKSLECLRYYGSDIAAKGGDISTAPIWYRAKRPIINITLRGVLALLQTASEWIVLMSDSVTCREVAVHPIVSSVSTAATANHTVIRTGLTDMIRGSATFITATTTTAGTATAVTANTPSVIDLSVFTISSASMTLTSTRAISKTPVAVNNLCINAESGIVAVPIYNNEAKSSVGLSLVNVSASADSEPSVTSQMNGTVKKLLSICQLPSKKWLVISPIYGRDNVNASITVVGTEGAVAASEEILLGNDNNSTTNRLEKRLITHLLPSGRVLVLNGNDVHTLKIVIAVRGMAEVKAVSGNVRAAGTSLAAALKSAKKTTTVEESAASSSRLANWETLVDASAGDVYSLFDISSCDDEKLSDAVVEGLINLNDLPENASTALAYLPFVEWAKSAKRVKNVHNALKVAHLVFLAALKRGAISVASIAARGFDALYALTGDDASSSDIAHEMRSCLQQISTWAHEQMGRQIGVVTVHSTQKSPAIKQAMFIPHQPFAVTVKRNADIDRKEYKTAEPPRSAIVPPKITK